MVLWCADSLVVLSVDHHVRRHGVSGFNAHDMTRHDVIIFRFRNVPLLIRAFFSGTASQSFSTLTTQVVPAGCLLKLLLCGSRSLHFALTTTNMANNQPMC